MRHKIILGSILLSFLLWYLMFVIKPFNFWFMMSFSTMLLSLFAVSLGTNIEWKAELNWKNIGLGIASAVVLYAVFLLGHFILITAEKYLPFLNHRADNLNSIYANRGELAAHWNALLLFFPIGFGEELYWRGLIQKHFSNRMSRLAAFFLATALYTAVHLPTGNVVLILAAFSCGLYWGGLYMISGKLLPVLISHMIWDPFIFVIKPII